MGMSHGAGGGGKRRRRGKRGPGPINEINMTPFIDVVLVLLIVFMVAAPMMTVGVPLDLPHSKASPLNSDVKPITLSVRQSGQIFLGETELKDDDIVPQLMETSKAGTGTEERVFVRGDKRVEYGRIAQVMAIVTGGGFKKVALVTEPEQN